MVSNRCRSGGCKMVYSECKMCGKWRGIRSGCKSAGVTIVDVGGCVEGVGGYLVGDGRHLVGV